MQQDNADQMEGPHKPTRYPILSQVIGQVFIWMEHCYPFGHLEDFSATARCFEIAY
jgi:hypothetical protein